MAAARVFICEALKPGEEAQTRHKGRWAGARVYVAKIWRHASQNQRYAAQYKAHPGRPQGIDHVVNEHEGFRPEMIQVMKVKACARRIRNGSRWTNILTHINWIPGSK